MKQNHGPFAYTPRQYPYNDIPTRPRRLVPLFLATVLLALIGTAALGVGSLNQSPWMLETFAMHPDCPMARC